MNDQELLRMAIDLAREKMELEGGGPFGAVVAADDAVLGRGWNQVTTQNDPTAHAEVMAIRDACARKDHFSLAGATIYCSCEPCPMCFAAIRWARLDRIVFGATGADAAKAGFDDQVIYSDLLRTAADREIPMVQMLAESATQPLRLWTEKSNRIDY